MRSRRFEGTGRNPEYIFERETICADTDAWSAASERRKGVKPTCRSMLMAMCFCSADRLALLSAKLEGTRLDHRREEAETGHS